MDLWFPTSIDQLVSSGSFGQQAIGALATPMIWVGDYTAQGVCCDTFSFNQSGPASASLAFGRGHLLVLIAFLLALGMFVDRICGRHNLYRTYQNVDCTPDATEQMTFLNL